jgi:putative membrane protein (TIGR04086 family)
MEKQDSATLSVIKGVATSVIVTLVSVLIFAFIVKSATLNSSVIKSVNQFIKIISVFLGVITSVRGKMGLVKGIIIGALATIFTYIIFAFISGSVQFGKEFFCDLIFGLIVGGISGIIAVNIKKNQ